MSDNIYQDAQDSINRGIEWLNEVRPNWADEINLETFNLSDVGDCVLGQLGMWEEAEAIHGCDGYLSISTLRPLGFYAPKGNEFWFCETRSQAEDGDRHDFYEVMTDMWAHEIRKIQSR